MHIALVTHHYPPEVGAPQRRWSAFVERFVAAGHRVSVLTPPPHYPSGHAEELGPELRAGAIATGQFGETVYRVRFREHESDLVSRTVDHAISAGSSLGRGIRHLVRDRPDVIVATAPGIPTIPAAMLLGSLLRRPTVVEMRDAWPDLVVPSGILWPDAPSGPRARTTAVAHRVLTDLQRHATAVVTTTVSFAAVLRQRGIREVMVIRNGAHVADLPTLTGPTLDRVGLRVLYLGNLGRSQGLASAIAAADLARRQGTSVTLRFVGSGSDEVNLRAEAERLNAPALFLGRVRPDEVAAQYAWADTALVSLRGWEPFAWTVPSKLYEILAVNRHVSAAVTGEAAAIVGEAGAGDTVAPQCAQELADLWVSLARDRRRLDVRGRGRAWVVENAEHDALAARYLRLLESVAP